MPRRVRLYAPASQSAIRDNLPMTRLTRSLVLLAATAAVICLAPARPTAATPFTLQAGDHICIIGNQLAERMQYEGWLDTLLHARFPRHDLVIRNLGFSGDEVATRLRSKNFGTPDEWLSGKGEPNMTLN